MSLPSRNIIFIWLCAPNFHKKHNEGIFGAKKNLDNYTPKFDEGTFIRLCNRMVFRWGLLNADKQGGRWRTVNDLIIGDKLSNKEVHMSPEHAVAHRRKKEKRYSAQLFKMF